MKLSLLPENDCVMNVRNERTQCFLTHRKTEINHISPAAGAASCRCAGSRGQVRTSPSPWQLPLWVSGPDSVSRAIGASCLNLRNQQHDRSCLWLCNGQSLFSSRRPRNTSQSFSHILIAVCRVLFLCLVSAVPAFPSVCHHGIAQVLTRLICRIPGSERPRPWCKYFSRNGKC